MRWTVHGERVVYDSEWMRLALADVEPPGHARFEHHVVRFPHPAAGVVVHDPSRGLLLLWRHRFATDTWGWEIPAGRVDPGESIEEGAVREVIEETGWGPGALHHLVTYHPINGSTDATFVLFLADGATHLGDPSDRTESERVEWVPVARVRDEMDAGRIRDGMSLTAICWSLAHDLL